jgi:tetraacyldisaccharide 4'-kinase
MAEPIVRAVRRWNSRAAIFRASVEPRAWVENVTGKRYRPTDRPFTLAGAFCGLGNPATFRRSLDGMGVELVDWIEFDDHHRYRPQELRHIAHQVASKGATALVTTQKDAINLCEGSGELTVPLSLYWLEIGMKIEGEEEFLQAVERVRQSATRA